MSGRALRLVALSTLAAGLLSLVLVAQGRSATTYTLNVAFNPNGTITVTLPDGTPVGSTSGAPTLIPAGYYTLQLAGPGACVQLPLFELKGPGEDIFNDMTSGEEDYTTLNAFFRPSSTYTWRNYATPGVTHTFVTSADAAGPAPVAAPTNASLSKKTVSSQDLVGSGLAQFRGALTGTVSRSGALALDYKGSSVSRLKQGRYKITVTDQSKTGGFMLVPTKHAPVNVTGAAFVGKRSVSVLLTAGKWLLSTAPGTKTYPVVVS